MKRGSTKVHSFRLLWLVMVGALVLATSSCELFYQLFNQPPEAGFSVGPSTAGAAPFAITATSTSSDPDDNIEGYAWQFGDGGVGAGPSATHTYTTPGTWTIVLTVTDKYGAKDIATKTVLVVAAQVGPAASFTATPTSGTAPLYVSFNATASTYADGAIQSYTWDFGDGSSGYGSTASHTYYTAGTYTVTLTVRATDGETGTATKTITASTSSGGGSSTSGAPSARFAVAPTIGIAPLRCTLDPKDSKAAEGRTLILYTWSFGDGEAVSDINPSVKTHVYTTNTTSTTFSAKLIVLDNEGASNAITKTVKAYNHQPVAGFEIANPPGGNQGNAGAVHYTTLADAWDAGEEDEEVWQAKNVVYGDLLSLGELPQNVTVVIRSQKIPDPRWFDMDGTKTQATLTTASGTSATSSNTPAKPVGYTDHNFSYDPEGQTWDGGNEPAWFPDSAGEGWGIRYLYVNWGDGSATEQVRYAEDDWSAYGGDILALHVYNVNVDGMTKTITVTVEDWLGYRSAAFSRTVLFKRGEETTDSEV